MAHSVCYTKKISSKWGSYQ